MFLGAGIMSQLQCTGLSERGGPRRAMGSWPLLPRTLLLPGPDPRYRAVPNAAFPVAEGPGAGNHTLLRRADEWAYAFTVPMGIS